MILLNFKDNKAAGGAARGSPAARPQPMRGRTVGVQGSRQDPPLKILFLTRAYGQQAGGLERFNYELIQAISKHPGVDTQVIKHTGTRAASPLFIFTVIPRALTTARQADIVHLSDPLLSLPGWLIKKLLKKPVTINVHGLDITYPKFPYQTYLKLFFTHFDAYFPISQHVNTLLVRWHVSGTQTVINPGITDRFFDPSIFRQKLFSLINKQNQNQTILLTVGRLVKRKGHAWFIANALPHLPKNTVYVIAGHGPEADNIKQTALKHQVSDRVVLLGKAPESDLKTLYNTADAFIQPNIKVKHDVEGFGLVLLEAALCNLPVYAANIGGIPDAIHHNKNGILVACGNPQAWIDILSQPISLANNPRSYTLANFSWDKTSPNYYQALAKLRTTPPS